MARIFGIVAGRGQFPALVAQGARAAGYSVAIVGFVGHTDPALSSEADVFAMLHLGQVDKLITFFKTHGVRELCFAGAISKPSALDLRPDMRAMKLLFSLRGKGDDAILRCVADELAVEGLTVISPTQFVPSLLAPLGILTRRSPDKREWDDIRFAWPIAQTLGRLDIGQLVVVREGIVTAVEALEGTDAALERGGSLGGKGCVAVKLFKPGQDNRMDQPAMGPNTITVMAQHGYGCLAYQAERSLFFDMEEAVALADKAHIAIVGLPENGPEKQDSLSA